MSDSPDRLRFDEDTRKAITDAFLKECNDDRRSDEECKDGYEVFILVLEGFAEAIQSLNRLNPPRQQRRREQIVSIANGLDKALDQIAVLDTAALGFVLWRAFEELAKHHGESNPLIPGFNAMLEADKARSVSMEEMKRFTLGVRMAAKELPEHDYNVLLKIALAVERQFFDHGLKFTVSNTGFAALCLRSVFSLGGQKIDRVDYWLGKARESEESMSSLLKRYAQNNPEESR